LTARNTTFSPTRPGSLDGSPARSSLYINVNCPARLVNTTVVDPETYWALTVNGTLSLTNTAVVSRMGPIVGALDADSSFNNFVRGAGEIAGLVDGVNGNQVSQAPLLTGELGDHGGPVRTLRLLPGSPALNAGTNADADVPATDARGLGRVGAPDIGAFESRGFQLAAASFAAQSTLVGTSFAD